MHIRHRVRRLITLINLAQLVGYWHRLSGVVQQVQHTHIPSESFSGQLQVKKNTKMESNPMDNEIDFISTNRSITNRLPPCRCGAMQYCKGVGMVPSVVVVVVLSRERQRGQMQLVLITN